MVKNIEKCIFFYQTDMNSGILLIVMIIVCCGGNFLQGFCIQQFPTGYLTATR